MRTFIPARFQPTLRRVALLLTPLLVAACATSQSPRTPPVQIEIQEAVGFTITEQARISSDVRMDYDRAIRSLERGELEQGIEILGAIVEVSPGLAAPRVDLGIAHHLAGDLEAAETHLLLALESNPSHPIAHNELGIVYRKTGRFTAAKRSYEAALTIYPGYHFARRNLAILCDLYLADLDCALKNYEAYMATVKSDDEASMWITDIRNRMGQGR